MSLLDQLEITDNTNSAKSVSDMSTDVVDTLEPYMSWYDYVNSDSNYTHILAICINEKFYDHWTIDWITLMKMIMYSFTKVKKLTGKIYKNTRLLSLNQKKSGSIKNVGVVKNYFNIFYKI